MHLNKHLEHKVCLSTVTGLCFGSTAGVHLSAELLHFWLTPIQELQSVGKEELPNAHKK